MNVDLLEVFNLSPINSFSSIDNYQTKINRISNTLEDHINQTTLYYLDDFSLFDAKHKLMGNFVFYVDKETNDTEFSTMVENKFYQSNILLIKGKERYEEFRKTINDLFFNSTNMQDFIYRLVVSLQNKDELEYILNYVYSYFGNPILIVDDSFTVIKHTGYPKTTEIEHIWDETIKNGYMPSDYVKDITQEQRKYRNMYNSSAPLIQLRSKNSFNYNHNQLSARIMCQDNIIGYVKILAYNRPFTDKDKFYLSIFARFLSVIINTHDSQTSPERNNIEKLLKGILSGTYTQKETIENRRRIYRIKFYEDKYVLTFKFFDKNLNTRYYNVLKNIIMSNFNRESFFIHDSKLVFLFDSRLDTKEFESIILPKFHDIARDQNCQVFVSSPFNELIDFKEHYNHTLYAENIASVFKIDDYIVTYQDVFEKHILFEYSKKVNLKNMIHPSLSILKDADDKNNSELFDTLLVYVATNQNIKDAAQQMSIHYNTMRYRIDKISEITQLDFNNAEDINRIMLSNNIINLYNHMETD